MKDNAADAHDREPRAAAGDFGLALSLMRRRDPQELEDGFGPLRQMAQDHAAELLAEYARETDYRTRFLLLELIGDARSALAFDLLAAELRNEDEILSSRAERGLSLLDTEEAHRVLRRHRAHRPGAAGRP